MRGTSGRPIIKANVPMGQAYISSSQPQTQKLPPPVVKGIPFPSQLSLNTGQEPEPEIEPEPEQEPGSGPMAWALDLFPAPIISATTPLVKEGDYFDPDDLPNPDPDGTIEVKETYDELAHSRMIYLDNIRKYKNTNGNCINVELINTDSKDLKFLTLINFILAYISQQLSSTIDTGKSAKKKRKCYIPTTVPDKFSVKIEVDNEILNVEVKYAPGWFGTSSKDIEINIKDKKKYIGFLVSIRQMISGILQSKAGLINKKKHTKKKHTKKKHTKKKKKKHTKKRKKKNTKRRR